MIERDRKDLVGSESRVVAVVAIDDIVEIAPRLAPEAVVERNPRPVGMRGRTKKTMYSSARSLPSPPRTLIAYAPLRSVSGSSSVFVTFQLLSIIASA